MFDLNDSANTMNFKVCDVGVSTSTEGNQSNTKTRTLIGNNI